MKFAVRLTALLVCFALLWMTACGGVASESQRGGTSSGGGSSPITGSIKNVNHIIFLIQENRSFDHYFGKMSDYRKANNIPGDVDGWPASGVSNIGWDGSTVVTPIKMISACSENLSPNWQESHSQYNLHNPSQPTVTNPTPGNPPLNGFAAMAGGFSEHTGGSDVIGRRALGYYDWDALPYYYYMASQFAMSDRWFAPAPARTQPNRMYALAATSWGFAYPPTTSAPVKTIFHQLEEKQISWKIYTTTGYTYLMAFQPFASEHKDKIVPIQQYFDDLTAGTLPSVVYIETEGIDEHPNPGQHIQVGAQFTAKVINALMQSSAWKDSVFFLTFDEGGGFYDHVAPIAVPNPDDIKPRDLPPGDPSGDFDRTGFRIPFFVVSPFAKKNYVSHLPADNTAILKFIQTRYELPSLTKRDAAMPDISTDMFDFGNPPWRTPPTPPDQPINMPCYSHSVP